MASTITVFNCIGRFPGGHIRSLIYETSIETEDDLMARVVVDAHQTEETPGVMGRVYQIIIRRYIVCNDVGGGRLTKENRNLSVSYHEGTGASILESYLKQGDVVIVGEVAIFRMHDDPLHVMHDAIFADEGRTSPHRKSNANPGQKISRDGLGSKIIRYMKTHR